MSNLSREVSDRDRIVITDKQGRLESICTITVKKRGSRVWLQFSADEKIQIEQVVAPKTYRPGRVDHGVG